MILVDTSVWIDHFRRGDGALADLLDRSAVLIHPFVIGELALGSLRDRELILELLSDLPAATVADDAEVLRFIARHALHGQGVGYVDTHLLTATALTVDCRLWTRDRRLHRVARELGLASVDPDL